MAPVIRIDDDVMERLKQRAIELRLVFSTPNEVLRVVLGAGNGISSEAGNSLPVGTENPGGTQCVVYNDTPNTDTSGPSSKDAALQRLLGEVVSTIREIAGDTVYFEKQEKSGVWMAQPNNFMTIRVQEARKRDLCITVYGNLEDFEDLETVFEIKRDRGSYSRFNLSSDDEIEILDVPKVLQRSFQLKSDGRRRRR